MTTISNQNSLINPLARTKGGCASNNTHQTHDRDREEVDDGYNGMMPILGIQEDEDIASIEAEGTGDTDNGGAAKSQSRDVESKILTAALVTSMEDASRGGCKPKSKDDQAVDSNSMMYQHVTPTTSESSSVETTDSGDSHNDSTIPYLNPTGAQTSRKTPNPLSSNSNATRTTYPRASKAAACTKVASALHCNASPRSRRKMDAGRKMDADKLESTQPPGKLMYPVPPVPHGFHPGSASVPNPLAGMVHPPQVTFQYTQYPQAKLPVAMAPSSNKKSSTNSFSQVATSMSTQEYQTDNIMSSSTNELMSSQSNQPEQEGRGRIFSIDLDPAVLDFVDNVDNPLGENASQGRKRGYSVTFEDDVISNSGKTSNRRDRGFSFELFSLGIDGDVSLPLMEDCNSSVATDERGNRLRGDSIIFDPISFHDGGIHETSALMHVTHGGDQDTQGQACSNTAVTAPPVQHAKVPPSIIHNPPMMRPSMPNQHLTKRQHRGGVTCHKPPKGSARHTKPTKPRAKTKSSVTHQPKTNYRQITVNISTRNFPQSFDDDTIHMPHGSHAATAAAAGMAPPSSTSSDGISSISHTSCPMELLNKDGRVGIYLPEERKARIAKFHDKRKQRMWRKKIKYDCRKKLADSRPRIKGRFVKRSDVN